MTILNRSPNNGPDHGNYDSDDEMNTFYTGKRAQDPVNEIDKVFLEALKFTYLIWYENGSSACNIEHRDSTKILASAINLGCYSKY